MIEQAFDRLTTLAESEKRRDRMVAGAWMVAVAPAMVVVAPLFFLAHGVRLLFRRKPL